MDTLASETLPLAVAQFSIATVGGVVALAYACCVVVATLVACCAKTSPRRTDACRALALLLLQPTETGTPKSLLRSQRDARTCNESADLPAGRDAKP
jgi:hypothetical protein